MNYFISSYSRRAPLSFSPFSLLSVLVLSGCQMLQPFPDEGSVSVVPKAPATTIASHEFGLGREQQVVGTLATVPARGDDTLSDLARHYGLGYNDIALANPDLNPWVLQDGQPVLLPLQFIIPETPRKGIVLNLANMRMFYYPKQAADSVKTYPVGVGRDGWDTPLGQTQIVAKKVNPDWTVPESILREHQVLGDPLPAVVHSGPDNPLGAYAMPLAVGNYLIHGTNKPYGIGMQVSHGCIQMYPEDIARLFPQVDVGTPVRIVHQPYLVAWHDGDLFLEANQPLEKWKKQDAALIEDVQQKLQKSAIQHGVRVDWQRVEQILQRKDGVPQSVRQGGIGLEGLRQAALPLEHPDYLQGRSIPNELTARDWTVNAGSFPQESEAQKFAAMLNHQGPPIPARKLFKEGLYQVVAGPFKSGKEARVAAKRIKGQFEFDAVAVAPGAYDNQSAAWGNRASN